MSRDFKTLQKLWYSKLKESGFDDIENEDGKLYQPDNRTINFQNQEAIREYYLQLDDRLTHDQTIKSTDRSVLELYREGQYIKQIAKQLDLSISSVQRIIKKYGGPATRRK